MSEALEGVPLTDGERKAYRLGLLDGLLMRGEVEAELRVRIAARSVAVEAPTHWPVLRAKKKAAR